MSTRFLALMMAVAAASLPLVGAQGAAHEHESGAVRIVAPADGTVFAGLPAKFVILDGAADGVPDFHQNNAIVVRLNGQVLLDTTAAAGHDYDGVNILRIVFPATGTYEVEASTGDGSTARVAGSVLPSPVERRSLSLEIPATAPEAQHVLVVLHVTHPDGTADNEPRGTAILDAMGPDGLAARLVIDLAASEYVALALDAGEYDIVATAWNDGVGAWSPAVAKASITVEPSTNLPLPDGGAGYDNRVVEGDGGFDIVATFDPYDAVAPAGIQHIALVATDGPTHATVEGSAVVDVLDSMGRTVAHFGMPMRGPEEFVYRTARPGIYALTATATAGSNMAAVLATWRVMAPTGTAAAGPIAFTLSGESKLHPAAELGLALHGRTLAGDPYAHSDVDVVLRQGNDAPVLWTKLHTHGDGDYPLGIRLNGGDYQLLASPSELEASPVTFHGPAGIADATRFTFQVDPGHGFEDADPAPATTTAPAKGAANLATPALLAIVAFAAVALRRRFLL